MKKTSLYIMMLLLCKISFSELVLNASNPSPSRNEDFSIEVSFLNEDKGKYTIEGIENFDIISKASTNSYNSINGKTTSAKSDIYRVRAKSEGEFSLKVKTEKGVEKVILIDVQKSQSINSALSDRFILKSTTPKTTFYFGEKIPYEEYFISGVRVSSLSQAKKPNFKDFSVKDMTPYSNNNYIQTPVDFNGKQGIQVTLFKGVLQANGSGLKSISSSSVKVGEPTRDFFNENTSYIGDEDIEIDIKPLPDHSPTNFKDIVGTLNSLESWKTKEVNVGEAITLTLTLQGSGNLALLDSLPIKEDMNFNVFQTIKGYNEKIIDGKYFNEKIFEIAFIPKKNGVQKTPIIDIPYFNTITEKYEILNIPSEEIVVNGKSVSSEIKIPQNTNISPIDKNIEKNMKNIDLEMIQVEKISPKNIFKLISVIFGFIALIEGAVISYLLYTRKQASNSKKR